FHRGAFGHLRAGGSERFVLLAERKRKNRVDEFQNRRLAAKVLRQRQSARRGRFFLQRAEDLWISAAEAIDRLLEIADKEKPPPLDFATQGFDQIDLERVGVLKLID